MAIFSNYNSTKLTVPARHRFAIKFPRLAIKFYRLAIKFHRLAIKFYRLACMFPREAVKSNFVKRAAQIVRHGPM